MQTHFYYYFNCLCKDFTGGKTKFCYLHLQATRADVLSQKSIDDLIGRKTAAMMEEEEMHSHYIGFH